MNTQNLSGKDVRILETQNTSKYGIGGCKGVIETCSENIFSVIAFDSFEGFAAGPFNLTKDDFELTEGSDSGQKNK